MATNLNSLLGGGGGQYQFQLFTSSGTWTRPAGVDTVLVTMIGGGGSGGFSSSASVVYGGWSGEYIIRKPFTVTGNVSVTIGAGGAAQQTFQNNGISGGNTVFGSLTATGGAGGGWLNTNQKTIAFTAQGAHPGAGGTYAADQGQVIPGEFGGRAGWSNQSASGGGGGAAGLILDTSNKRGGNAESTVGLNSEGVGGTGYGAGGGSSYAGSSTNSNSGAGASGAVLVEWLG